VAFPLLGFFFLDHLLKLVQFLAQLRKGLLYGIGFLSAKIRFSVLSFLNQWQSQVLCVKYVPPRFLQRLQCFLARAFFGGTIVSTRSLYTLFIAVRSFLIVRYVRFLGSFLATYAFNSLKRQKEQKHVHRSTTFLVKVVLILPYVRTHSENATRQISLGKRHVHGNRVLLHTWAVVPAGQLCNLGVELLYMLHKLTNADALGFLQHVCDIVPLLLRLSRAIGEHGEKVEHHTVLERLERHSPGPFPGQPLEVCVGVGSGLFLDNLVPHVPCVDGQKVDVELEHVLSHLITFGCGFLCDLHGLLKLSLDVNTQGC
jgi:hypothetical protein